MKIDYYGCYDEWSEVLVKEVLEHGHIPDDKMYETEAVVTEMDDRGIYISYEYFNKDIEPDEEGGEPGGWEDGSVWIRYWIDQEWPHFCVSYFLYSEDNERLEEGAYQLVYRRGKGKCVPIE